MIWISMSETSNVHKDNKSVIHNTSKPESMFKKKCNAIGYHAVSESVAMGESLTGHIKSDNNLADLLTKIVTGYEHKHLVSLVMYDIYHGDT